jgi:hypothetical protein
MEPSLYKKVVVYTENKVITLCLRDPVTKILRYEYTRMLLFMNLPMLYQRHGHNEEFKKNFALILRSGQKENLRS